MNYTKIDAFYKLLTAREDDGRRFEEWESFREEALFACGLMGHKKADKAFGLAWEHGHSSGYYEVFSGLVELASLLLED